MRKLIIFSFLMGLSITGYSQINEGTIIYEEKFNIHQGLPPEMEAMKDRIPEYRIHKKILTFKNNESLYKAYKDEAEEKPQEFDNRRRRWGNREDIDELYTDLSDFSSIDRKSFFGKEFLIEGERDIPKWKITAEQKQVGSYLCQKAILKDSTDVTVAWFTPMIPVQAGPDDFIGLPGTVLHIDFNDGLRTITAQTISLEPLSEDITRPDKGKKVTKEEFEKLREEKMKEREQEFGGRGRGGYWFRH